MPSKRRLPIGENMLYTATVAARCGIRIDRAATALITIGNIVETKP